jgi:hypothetical protein
MRLQGPNYQAHPLKAGCWVLGCCSYTTLIQGKRDRHRNREHTAPSSFLSIAAASAAAAAATAAAAVRHKQLSGGGVHLLLGLRALLEACEERRNRASLASFEQTHKHTHTPASPKGNGRLLNTPALRTLTVLEAAGQGLHVLHAPGAGGLAADLLLAPLESPLLGGRVATGRAGGLLDVEALVVAPTASRVRLCV